MTGNGREKRQPFSLLSLFLSSLMSEISLIEESKISAYMVGRLKPRVKSRTVGCPLLKPFSGIKLAFKLV